MERTLRPYYCLLATLLFMTLFVSAQNPNPMFGHLPPDSKRIYHINLPALTSKISWEELMSNIPLSKLGGGDQHTMELFKDPSQAGVDIHQDIFVAEGQNNNKLDSITIATVLIHLTDSGKFISMLQNDKEKGLRVLLPGKGRVFGKDKWAVAYDDKLAALTFITIHAKATGAASLEKTTPGAKRTVASPLTAAYTLNAARKSLAALHGFAGSIYTTDPAFIAGFSDDADFHMWGPHGEGIGKMMEMVRKKAMPGKNSLSMANRGAMMHTLTALRFDAGKITMHTSTAVPPDSARYYRILNSRPLNADLINRLPGKALLGMLNLHFDPTFLPEFLERLGVRHMLDSSLSSKGLTTAEIMKAFKGDFLIAGVEPAKQSDTGKVKPDLFFVTTIGDPGAFMKLAGKLKLGSDSAGGLLGKKTAYTLKDNILVIGRSKESTDSYFSNSVTRKTDLIDDRVRTNLFSLVVDLKAVMAFMRSTNADASPKTQQAMHFLGVLDRVTIAGGGFQNGVLESTFEFKLADASENSLRSIFKLLH
jgi:hypothetical protein